MVGMDDSPAVITLNGIKKVYRTGDEDTVALDNVDLTIRQGEFVAIMGPSGSGKSTLMHIIGLLDKPTSGVYQLEGQDVSKIRPNRQSELRNQKIGFVFQQFNLLPRTSVLDNVLLPSIYGPISDPVGTAKKLIAKVELADRINNKSNQLSGGQIQRVAIARALMMNPAIMLADEPTGNLDSKRSAEIMELLEQINHAGSTVVIITHEPDIAKYARRIIELRDGQIVSDQPTHPNKT
jgi:putative ABC transport system ATP-binding protein